jgi:acyl carrier protein
MNRGEELRAFIIDSFMFGRDNGAIRSDTSFIEQGVVDSTGVLELISFIEKQYGIAVLDEEMVPENLDCIDNLVRFISEKQRSVGTSSASRG